MRYLDFDLSIEKEPDGPYYRAQVINSPAGQASTSLALPFSEQDINILLLTVGRPRRGTRRIDSPQMEAAKNFGRRLFDAAFGGDVRSCMRSSLDEAQNQDAGLRIRLRMNGAPELSDLPWEYLFNSVQQKFFSLSAQTPIVRYLDLHERIRPFRVDLPLRILVMVSTPEDDSTLDVEEEWKRLNDALAGLIEAGMVELTRLEDASLKCLLRTIRKNTFHVFHFIGHGGFSNELQDGQLILENGVGRRVAISGSYLGTLLHDHRSLRLVVLNACDGARNGRTDLFSGVAQSLVQQGIPAVIAMQFEISDEAAITFAHEFYMAVAEGFAIDASLAEARKAIFARGTDVEWGTPVLFMRTHDGQLFDVARIDPAERKRLLEAVRRKREEAEQQRLVSLRDEEESAAKETRQAQLHAEKATEAEARRLALMRKQQELAAEQALQAKIKKRKDKEAEQLQREALRKQKELAAQQARQAEEKKRKEVEAEQQRLVALREQQAQTVEQARQAEIQKCNDEKIEEQRLEALRTQQELAAERARHAEKQKRSDEEAERQRWAL